MRPILSGFVCLVIAYLATAYVKFDLNFLRDIASWEESERFFSLYLAVCIFALGCIVEKATDWTERVFK